MATEADGEDIRSTRKTRRSFLAGGLVTSAGVIAAQAIGWPASAAAQHHPVPQPGPQTGPGRARLNFIDIQRHENDHVRFLLNALGGSARPKPTFQNLQQNSLHDFYAVSQALENTGVGAYLGAAPAINGRDILAAAGSIALIEARHAGWLNDFVNARLTTNAFGQEQSFERALTSAEVGTLAGPFVASLNGGPPLSYSTTSFSTANDVAILNYALALEYLEAEFYNINVPRFFGHG